ncbi:hypothetical protein B0H14DRAFT_3760709 [Mycena olivaceomarginata]|nr:hypothetical protein B0H14DRAFT_3760709 [Mycena olivaceomarginata]
MSVERQEETNLAQLGRVAMWIETARWSDAELTVVTQEYRGGGSHWECTARVVCATGSLSISSSDAAPERSPLGYREVMGWRFSQAHDAPPKQKHWKEYPGDAEEPPAQGPIGTLNSASAQGSQVPGPLCLPSDPAKVPDTEVPVTSACEQPPNLESSGSSTLLVALGKGTIETVAEDLAIIVVIPAGGRGFLGEARDMASNWCQWFGEGNETGVFRARARGNGVIDEQEFRHPRDHGLLFMQCPRCNQYPGMMGEPFSAMTVVEKWMSLRPVLDVL